MSRIVTKEEAEALPKFRERISDLIPSLSEYRRHDIWLLKWLRDKDLTIDRADRMLRKYIEWREEEKMGEILYWEAPEEFKENFPLYVPGVDKDGAITCILHFGRWDIPKFLSKGYRWEMIRYTTQIVEAALMHAECTSTNEKYLNRFNIIMDFDGFSITRFMHRETIEIILEVMKIYAAYYPETLKACWLVNGPMYVDLFFKLVKPILSPRTLARFNIFRRKDFRAHLLTHFDPEQLPSQMGGSNTTPELYDVSIIQKAVLHLSSVPDANVDGNFLKHAEKEVWEYIRYLFKSHETFPDNQFKLVVLGPGEKHRVEYYLSPGNKICWNFRTDLHDVKYVVKFLEKGQSDSEILFTGKKADAHLYVQKGTMVAEKEGTYTLILSNSKSRKIDLNVYLAVRVSMEE